MECSIDDFALTNGTLSGGYALHDLRFEVQRIYDVAIQLNGLSPVVFERGVRKTIVDFTIARIHSSFANAEKYAIDHDALVPSSGVVQFTTTLESIRKLVRAHVVRHQCVLIYGKLTVHAYHIEGGQRVFYRLLENGEDYRLLEDFGKRELEYD